MKFAACCLNTEKERLTVFQVYAFNVTNSASWLAGREALRVEEVGPFVYRFVQEVVTIIMRRRKRGMLMVVAKEKV